MNKVTHHISELDSMKKYPKELFYSGNLELLDKKKISIVGTRRPSKYSKSMIQTLSSTASKSGICIVSGGAMGIDAISHIGAGAKNTIAVLPCGIDIKYPAVNKNLLSEIEQNGLLLSQFEMGFRSTAYSFVLRNEIVVALGDVLIVGEAEIGSGSMRSVEYALAMGKEIFVLPQRLGESSATNELLKSGKAKAIYDIDEFVASISGIKDLNLQKDDFLDFCKTNPTYEEALKRFPNRVFEAELCGEIAVKDARVHIL
ncbi:MAG: DNA-protecting protein DprA [Campylobacterales bacterium]|nr:DNA-protecting protein DprA [Campylobacterales bacterium]